MFDVNHILQAGGLLGIGFVLFAEAALLLGLFLPGDTLLIAGGIFAAQHKISLAALLVVAIISTICGYQVGFWLGARLGPLLFKDGNDNLFRQDYLTSTEDFFTRHGGKTLLVARFIAIVRTIVPLVAGMGKMAKRTFLIFNIVGGILWSVGIILLSYWVGRRVPNLDEYIQYLVLLAIVATWISVAYELKRDKPRRQALLKALREEFRFMFRR